MVEAALKPVADDQMWFNQFRIGLWPKYLSGSQFPKGEAALDQFFRSVTPNTGPFDLDVVSSGAAAVLQKTGPAILFTHSQAGGPSWKTAIKSPNVRAIAAFEPGSSFVFAKGDAPAPIPRAFDTVVPAVVSPEEFKALTHGRA